MKEAATLVLAPAEDTTPGSPTGETVLLGIPLVRRAALAAARAGFDRVYVLKTAADGMLEGTAAQPFPREASESSLLPGRIVLLPERVAVSPASLRSLRE